MTKKLIVGHGADQPMEFTSEEANLDWYVDVDWDDNGGATGPNHLIIRRGDEDCAIFSCWSYVVAE